MIEVLKENFARGLEIIKEVDHQELEDQGHVATGALKRSIKFRIVEQGDKLVGEFQMLDYGQDINDGVPAERVTWSPNRYRRWAKIVKPELSEKELDRFVYNVWRKHVEEGIPTDGSKIFSKTGERTGFLNKATERAESNFDGLFKVGAFLEDLLDYSFQVLEKQAA